MKSIASIFRTILQKVNNIEKDSADHSYVDKKVAALVNGAPEQLDTLKELSAALNNDKDFATTVTNALAGKLDKTAKAASASSADSIAWGNVTGKPSTFAPASHNHDSIYAKKGGDTVTGILDLKSTSVAWVGGRDQAPLRQKTWNNYSPFSSIKTQAGSWDNGAYTDNILHWSYITDANHSKGTNTQTADIQFKPNGEIAAPAFRGRFYGTADAVAWSGVSGKPTLVVVESFDSSSGTLKLKSI